MMILNTGVMMENGKQEMRDKFIEWREQGDKRLEKDVCMGQVKNEKLRLASVKKKLIKIEEYCEMICGDRRTSH